MSISNKTRKILWGRSGNRCAICKEEIVVDSTLEDAESVVAEECHIISPQSNGPRYDQSYPKDKLDTYENLILLCCTHHKLVDDQESTFTPDILRQMKANHELWVRNKLSETQKKGKPVKIRQVKQNIPDFLFRLTTGKEVLDLVTGAMGYGFDHEDLKTQDEVDLVSGFLQDVQNLGDFGDILEAGAHVQTDFELTSTIKELEKAGYFVFGGREIRVLEGGTQETPSDWPIVIIKVLRKGNNLIMNYDFSNIGKEEPQEKD